MEFLQGKQFKDGYRNTCKACARIQYKEWYKIHGQEVRDRAKRWGQAHPEQVKNTRMQVQYGISESLRQLIEAEQDGLCAICSSKVKLVVDHNHKTDRVRGLLCFSCNSLLGFAKDNPDILQKAITYLKYAYRREEENCYTASMAPRKIELQAEASSEVNLQEYTRE